MRTTLGNTSGRMIICKLSKHKLTICTPIQLLSQIAKNCIKTSGKHPRINLKIAQTFITGILPSTTIFSRFNPHNQYKTKESKQTLPSHAQNCEQWKSRDEDTCYLFRIWFIEDWNPPIQRWKELKNKRRERSLSFWIPNARKFHSSLLFGVKRAWPQRRTTKNPKWK